MNSFYLIWKNLTRNKLRLVLNAFAIFVAFFLFGVLGAIKQAFNAGVDVAGADRLIVVNKVNFTQPLPFSYANKVAVIDGVKQVTYMNWFGGYYQNPKNQIFTFAADPDTYFDVYDDVIVDSDELAFWKVNRDGLMITASLAKKESWKVGDRIPLNSNIFSHRNGGRVWDVVVSGIIHFEDKIQDSPYALMHYKYFMENQSFGGDWLGWLTVTTDSVDVNDDVIKRIDDIFMNSTAETNTTTEKAFNKSFVEQIGDVGLILSSVIMAAFFTILLIVGNSMAVTIRERTRELAVLKTLGFSAKHIFKMVLAESLLLSVLGGLLGVLGSAFVVSGLSQVPQLAQMFPNLVMTSVTVIQSMLMIVALGIITGFLPALRAMRLNTIDALVKG